MKVPVRVVVQVVNAKREACGFVKLVANPRIDRKKAAHARIGKAIDIGIVKRAVLLAAVPSA